MEARDVNSRASQGEVCSLVGGCRAEREGRHLKVNVLTSSTILHQGHQAFSEHSN